ncbi:hypothetical protein K503DRAFT_775423 [Rhizopogon vinicolor AM-OR11-026]|uniref:PROP1-like PPR domain-containing protein n=1 Tax=Rhizopogon vinicolor AM-OR11-026 TaxID=1314800 RepID=A0A1B7MLZ9_9AGAM|nr:hypothetical protein K503DRAFT_775423 [Rhizopogon vinicolor AM-OR11-026]
MLPKVANHIFLHTSRAVAAVQNQTGHTLRNVLQLQTSTPGPPTTWTGAGSSSWGSNGAGPGGAKFNAGSRFYNGYTGAGRAVTQANASTSHDGNAGQSDDTDEIVPKRVDPRTSKRPITRRHSLSFGTLSEYEHERTESLSVLHTVQQHVRTKHTFAAPSTGEARDELSSESSRPPRTRRNSTAAQSTADSIDDFPSLLVSSVSDNSISTDPAAPQSVTDPALDHENGKITHMYESLRQAARSGDGSRVIREVHVLRTTHKSPTVAEFNMALAALQETRRPGEPLALLLETYNDMVQRSLPPNARTYISLILALTERDQEVQKTITSLDARIKRRKLLNRQEVAIYEVDEKRIEKLEAENNFSSAMSMFEAALIIGARNKVPLTIYNSLLRSCAYHANVDAAIRVFAQLESRTDFLPGPHVFLHLLSVYANAKDLQGAKEVFQEFREASRAGRVRGLDFSAPEAAVASSVSRGQLLVWNKMIEAYFRGGHPAGALRLLETMMDSNANPAEPSLEVPSPSSSTFTSIIAGFCYSGDVSTALSWFDRLLQQGEAARHPHESSLVPPRPDQLAWIMMLDFLAQEGMVTDLNRLYDTLLECAPRDGLEVRRVDHMLVLEANAKCLQSDTIGNSKAVKSLQFIATHTMQDISNDIHPRDLSNLVTTVFEHFVRYGMIPEGLDLAESVVKHELRYAQALDLPALDQQRYGCSMVSSILPTILERTKKNRPTFDIVLRIVRLANSVNALMSKVLAMHYLHAYMSFCQHGDTSQYGMGLRDHEALLSCALVLLPADTDMDQIIPIRHYEYEGLIPLLTALSKQNFQLSNVKASLIANLSDALYDNYSQEQLSEFFGKVSPGFRIVLEKPDESCNVSPIPSPAMQMYPPIKDVVVDGMFSRYVDDWFPSHPHVTIQEAYRRLQEGMASGKYVHPATLGRLINGFGRLGDLEKVHSLYDIAQIVLYSIENKQWQSQAWFQIEDQMIIACAHAGEMEAAFQHRDRITSNGGIPSPDAYGSLIECVRDTTDDTSNAMALFTEAQMLGCTPNVYLYNTTISKLAKARKADFALELFQQMKATPGIRPSSITYGAVIAACARVGDAQSAEQLFLEMSSQPNFRPRIPPFNMMMQLYAHTKPDRERVLHYYDQLLLAGVKPSAHTYKLLIDAYGTIEPVDVDAMEGVFKLLRNNSAVPLQGSHWAALINAYGCVKKDLDKAISTFDSIPSPDAVAYESLINVFVTNKQMALAPTYMEKLKSSGVHMTAYIANLLIKGYAAIGDIEEARRIFEGLVDPPSGVAASGNHVPHEGSQQHVSSPPSPSPSYREPSTWEAMFRAELGNGYRDRAVALLARLQERQFPVAVYNRIRGIMSDDSVSPWAASP